MLICQRLRRTRNVLGATRGIADVAVPSGRGDLNLRLVDLIHATRKSGFTALCTGATVAISASLVERGTIGPVAGVLVACGSAASVWIAALFAVQHPLLPELKAPVDRVFYAASRLSGHVPVPAARTDRDVC